MRRVKPVKLTPASFRAYGHVISTRRGRPLAKNTEIIYWGKVSLLEMGKTVSTGVLFGHERKAIVKSLERHTSTPEVLVALEGDSAICFGKPSLGDGQIQGIKAFYIAQGEAIAMHPGTGIGRRSRSIGKSASS
jgi:hypothetical protein